MLLPKCNWEAVPMFRGLQIVLACLCQARTAVALTINAPVDLDCNALATLVPTPRVKPTR